MVARSARRLRAGLPARMADDGGQARDFVFDADIAEANPLALETSVTSPVNIGTGLTTPVRTLLERLTSLARSVQPLERAPCRRGRCDTPSSASTEPSADSAGSRRPGSAMA